jgi:hypothetical protein
VTRTRRGPQFVLGLYVLLVAFAGVAGVLFSTVVERPEPPVLFFFLPLPPTALGFAVYGAVTVAVVLGVPLAGVVYASRTIDGETGAGRDPPGE